MSNGPDVMRTPPAAISATPIHFPDPLFEPAGPLARPPEAPLPSANAEPTAWLAAGYLFGGVTCLAALAIRWAVSHGFTPPNIIFSLFHWWGPLAVVVPAAGGFYLHRSRLARALAGGYADRGEPARRDLPRRLFDPSHLDPRRPACAQVISFSH